MRGIRSHAAVVCVFFFIGCHSAADSELPDDLGVVSDLGAGTDLANRDFSFPNWEVCGDVHDGGAPAPVDLATPASGPTQAPNFRIDAQHSGAQPRETLKPPLTQVWSLEVGQFLNYAIVANGRVFVTHGGGWPVPGAIVAADVQTGSVLWGPLQLGKDGLLAAYEDGRVFALDGDGLVTALDAATGQTLWSTQLLDESFFNVPPVTSDGILYVHGKSFGGVVYAVDEHNGDLLWEARTFDGSEGTVTVANGIVYDAESCAQVYAFDGKTGELVWHHCSMCSGGGGSVATAYGTQLYVREDGASPQNAVLDLRTGVQTGTLPMPKADGAMSLADGNAYLMNFVNSSGELRAVRLADGAVPWSIADINFVGSPLVAGGYVYAALSGKTLEAFDAATGQQVWMATLSDGIDSSPETASMTVAEGTLFVPVGTRLVAFR